MCIFLCVHSDLFWRAANPGNLTPSYPPTGPLPHYYSTIAHQNSIVQRQRPIKTTTSQLRLLLHSTYTYTNTMKFSVPTIAMLASSASIASATTIVKTYIASPASYDSTAADSGAGSRHWSPKVRPVSLPVPNLLRRAARVARLILLVRSHILSVSKLLILSMLHHLQG